MEFWNSTLYGNNYTLGIKYSYKALINDNSNINIITQLEKKYLNEGNNYEPLFWYAISDVEKDLNIKNDDNLNKAIYWINNNGGISLWESNEDKENWYNEINKLKNKLLKEEQCYYQMINNIIIL